MCNAPLLPNHSFVSPSKKMFPLQTSNQKPNITPIHGGNK